jgi:serine/threonine-protein kinase
MAMVLAHVQTPAIPPSQRTELEIPAELERLILDCLAKNPDERPKSMRDIARRLAAIRLQERWSSSQAEAWWQVHHPSPCVHAMPIPETSSVSVSSMVTAAQ